MRVFKVLKATVVSKYQHWHSDSERGEERGTASRGLLCMPWRALDMPGGV
jgi:hypothetical protein